YPLLGSGEVFCGTHRGEPHPHHPEPPPPPPPPPEEPPPDEPPPLSLDPGAAEADAMVCASAPSRCRVKPTGSLTHWLFWYQDDATAAVPAAASTPAKRFAQRFATSSAIA